VIKSVFPPSRRFNARHPATRAFQALRIAVNKELQNIEIFLDKIPFLIAKGGRLVILAYHSLEDRLVKQAMTNWARECTCPPDFPRCVCGKVVLFRRLFKKGIRPSQKEIDENPRARSAVLRAAERI
jgi:16S rRNA (cytosine1402-N4)-methyltransferase